MIFMISFLQTFLPKFNGQERKNKVSTSYKTVFSSKIFPKHNLVTSIHEQSILAVRIGKFGLLREPTRKLLFSADQFSHHRRK